jgi:hypothetical protein
MIELFIEGNRADVREDLPSLITYAVDDIKDFSSRNTAFSKTIVMPGTARNNALFGNIFDTANNNFYSEDLPNINYNFNAAKSASAIIFQDNIQIFKGVLRLLQIIIDKGSIEYEVAVFGDLGGLIYAMGTNKLEDLDFSTYNHTYNSTNIVNSWNTINGSGYYYPLMDYGTYSTAKHNWKVGTFRPALYVKEYIDKIFSAVGFTYSSNIFNSTRFKNLIIPHNTKNLTAKSSNFFAGNPTYKTYSGSGSSLFLEMTATSAGSMVLSSGNTVLTNSGSSITTNINLNFTGVWNSTGVATINIRKNGTSIASIYLGSGGAFNYFSKTLSTPVTLATSDYITITLDWSGSVSYNLQVLTGSLNLTSDKPVYINVNYGESVKMNDCIPKNILQIDFFSSIIKLFNLYVYEDKNTPNLLYIEPFTDFYDNNSLNAKDWSNKIDRGQPIKIKPMSELNSRLYKFNFKSDSDFYNDLYKKRYNIDYGSYWYDSLFEFNNAEQTADVIFSGTPLVGYTGEDKVYSTIFKSSNGNEESIDSNIRILQAKKITGVSSWNLTDSTGATTYASLTSYGYAGHLDSPDAPSNDLNFGVPFELFFVLVSGNLTSNQFNVYWSPYMAEITDKDSKLLTAYIRLTTSDINALDFSKLIYIDGVCFRINKIVDYNATMDDLCQVELLKVIN